MLAHKQIFKALLEELGHPVPSDEQLDESFQQAFLKVKKAEGIDPDKTQIKLTAVEIDKDWAKRVFSIRK